MIRNVRLILFATILTLFNLGFVNAYTKTAMEIINSPNVGAFEVGNWENDAIGKFAEGWSDWSTEVPTATKYAKAVVYLPVAVWDDRGYVTNASNRPARKEVCEGDGCYVYNPYKTEYDVCIRTETKSQCDRTSGHGGCGGNECGGCDIDYNNPTGTCTDYYMGQMRWCHSADACRQGGNKCYWLWNGRDTSYSYCAADEDRFWWSQSNVFKSNAKENWRRNLAEAGGFAKKIYVYSYPQRVYVTYDGMNADGLCTAWSKSATNVNTWNSNKKINYYKGNPVCNSKTGGSMSQNYINYYQNDTNDTNRNYKLAENQYMKTGYDFQGWVSNRSCLNDDGTLKSGSSCVIYPDQQVITNTPGSAPSGLGVNAGDTKTLYAVWKKHDYKITFEYWCGKNPNNLTYQYNVGLKLDPISMINADGSHLACNTTNKSDTNGTSAKTYFDGWYEYYDAGTGQYSSKLEVIPPNYWTDITLYGRMHQIRMFDYSKNKWKWQ